MRQKLQNFLIWIYGSHVRWPLVLILAGIVLRLSVMPFSAHQDLIFATWREHLYGLHHTFRLSDLSEILLALYIKLCHFFFNNNFDALFSRADSYGDLSTSFGYSDFIDSIHAMRYIFFLKLPYLIVDCAALYFIWNLSRNHSYRLRMLAFWAFNPLVIYAVYIWGRYEIFPIFFSIVALYLAKRDQKLWSILFIGLAIACRLSFVMVLPFFIIFYARSWRDFGKALLVAYLPIFCVGQANRFLGGEHIVAGLERGQFFQYVTTGQIGSGFSGVSLVLVIMPVLLYMFYKEKERAGFQKLIVYTTIGMLAFFANAKYHPQYFAWIAPFMMASIAINKKIVWPFIFMAIAHYIYIDANWEQGVTFGLFRPLNNDFFGHILSLYHQPLFLSLPKPFFMVAAQSTFYLMTVIISLMLYGKRNENFKA